MSPSEPGFINRSVFSCSKARKQRQRPTARRSASLRGRPASMIAAGRRAEVILKAAKLHLVAVRVVDATRPRASRRRAVARRYPRSPGIFPRLQSEDVQRKDSRRFRRAHALLGNACGR